MAFIIQGKQLNIITNNMQTNYRQMKRFVSFLLTGGNFSLMLFLGKMKYYILYVY